MARVVELEDMNDEQLKQLKAYLRSCIETEEIEEGWREGTSGGTLPLLRGLVRYISTEFIGEAPDDGYQYDDLDDDGDESDELDF